MQIIRLSSVLGLGVFLTGHAFAGVEITSEDKLATAVTPDKHTIYIAPDRLRVETAHSVILYRSDTSTITDIIKQKKEYLLLDPAATTEMKAERALMLEQAKKRLETMPEDARKQSEAMMESRGMSVNGPIKPPPLVKKGESKTIGSWSCDVYRQTLSDTGWIDFCIAPTKAIGLEADDVAAFVKLTGEIRTLTPDARGGAAFTNIPEQAKEIGFEGLPVETVTYRDSKLYSTVTVESVKHLTLADDQFAIPDGYIKKEIPKIPKTQHSLTPHAQSPHP